MATPLQRLKSLLNSSGRACFCKYLTHNWDTIFLPTLPAAGRVQFSPMQVFPVIVSGLGPHLPKSQIVPSGRDSPKPSSRQWNHWVVIEWQCTPSRKQFWWSHYNNWLYHTHGLTIQFLDHLTLNLTTQHLLIVPQLWQGDRLLWEYWFPKPFKPMTFFFMHMCSKWRLRWYWNAWVHRFCANLMRYSLNRCKNKWTNVGSHNKACR